MKKKILACLFLFLFIESNFLLKLKTKRFLIYPPSLPTRYQFIAGYGIPAELPDYQSLITGYVLKALFYLPSNSSELYLINSSGNKVIGNIPTQTVKEHFVKEGYFGRKLVKTEKKTSNLNLRWTIYLILQIIFERTGYEGQACLLRSICEIASIPFHSNNGLMGEIIHILMTPSSSCDIVQKNKHQQFLKAEILGKEGAKCEVVFRECRISVPQKFSFIKPIFDFFG